MNAINAKAQLMTQNGAIPKIDPKAEDKALREQTDAFEAVIVKMLMDNAAKGDKDLFSSQKDPGDKIYKSMYRDELSKASAGSFGFSHHFFQRSVFQRLSPTRGSERQSYLFIRRAIRPYLTTSEAFHSPAPFCSEAFTSTLTVNAVLNGSSLSGAISLS